MATKQEILENKHIKVVGNMLEDDRLLPCPFCGKVPKIAICDEEGNPRDIDYLDDPWSGLSLLLVHEAPEHIHPDQTCPIATFKGEALGIISYESVEEIVERWNKRI